MFHIDESKIMYTLHVEYDDIPVRGNAIVSGDDAYDRQVEDEILMRLSSGDVWAWACVRVSATYAGIPECTGYDYLGACCYKDEKDFTRDAYYRDMRENAKHDLIRKLQTIHARLDR